MKIDASPQAGDRILLVLAFTLAVSVMSATMFNIVLPRIASDSQLAVASRRQRKKQAQPKTSERMNESMPMHKQRPIMMKAAAVSAFGPPEVLRVIELEAPEPGPGEVWVRVKAAGVQPADLSVRKGWTPPGATVGPTRIPGNELAGVVDRVGEGVTGFAPGDEAIGFRVLNCYAEYAVVPADQLVAKPAGMPWEVAGALSASGQTAHTALRELGIGEGDTVLVHAAAGGVGSAAVQLARAWGATVIGTASPRNHDYLRSLGAIPVAYGEGLADRVRALAPQGIHAVLDAAGEDALRASVELVRDKSRVGTIVSFELAPLLGVRAIRSQRSAARLSELVELWRQDRLRVAIRRTFPLERAADAHRELETGHGFGKVVLTMHED